MPFDLHTLFNDSPSAVADSHSSKINLSPVWEGTSGHSNRLTRQTSSPAIATTSRFNHYPSYFDRKPALPSPTSSLVADLSQNFHLGQSPVIPTPRRSLMASFTCRQDEANPILQDPRNHFEAQYSGSDSLAVDTTEFETSPISRRPYLSLSQYTMFHEPRSKSAQSLANTHLSHHSNSHSSSDWSDKSLGPIRKSHTNRPLTARTKASSQFADIKPFLFPNSTQNEKENEAALSSLFDASPESLKKPLFGGSQFKEITSSSSKTASDLARSPLVPISGNRKAPKFRRTQSMIHKTEEYIAPQPTSPNSVPYSLLGSHMSKSSMLPFFDSQDDQLKRISGDTFAHVLDGHFQHQYDKLVIVDCRFAYEYAGGHVANAINLNTSDAVDRYLLENPVSGNVLTIFHCEYSVHRAPRLALHLRNRDRQLNMHRYPDLYYPEIYILEGGYYRFFQEHKQHVGGYVGMKDPNYKPRAAREMHAFRKSTKFARTQSYTFGENHFGGAQMQRETNFSLGSRIDRLPVNSICTSETTDNEMDGSMMDLDDVIDSPSATSQGISFKQTHARNNSGRANARRLSSF